MATVTHTIERQLGVTVLVFEGQIDLSNGKGVRSVVLDALSGSGDVMVDLSKVDYIDSSGIAHLVEGYQRARAAKKNFKIREASPQVLRVLKLTRLDGILLA